MSLFDKIEKAESMSGSEEISIRVDQFLSLIDIWAMCNVLTMQIHDQKQDVAVATIIKISELISELDSLVEEKPSE